MYIEGERKHQQKRMKNGNGNWDYICVLICVGTKGSVLRFLVDHGGSFLFRLFFGICAHFLSKKTSGQLPFRSLKSITSLSTKVGNLSTGRGSPLEGEYLGGSG